MSIPPLKEQVSEASERWQDDRVLPLPAQMFRMGAELAAQRTDLFHYALLELARHAQPRDGL